MIDLKCEDCYKQLNRSFIGYELDEEYFKIATKRIDEA